MGVRSHLKKSAIKKYLNLSIFFICSAYNELEHPGVAQLVAHMVWDRGVVGSSPTTRTMRSVLIGFEYPCGTLRIIFAQNP